ncbi:hypothetical protein [Bacillus sp. V5-8f]|uniref:hypothetical protein n=1 Tax=Bacillus sp. V5-8f TaxID=2053044 RepID=UPI000C75ABE8|nr:hypothetical protein [Bacillus sp. V5-8f]PLT35090.1 hypothetical protein CUU64_06830 [Bacillus sp. V5-8f]
MTKNKKESIQSNESHFLTSKDIKSIHEWMAIYRRYLLYTPWQKKQLALRTLTLPYKVIGNGLNRMVYDLDNGYVLKIALSEIGVISNSQEFNLYQTSDSTIRKYLAPVMEMGQGWIVMKKMDHKVPINLVSLQNLTELTMKFLLHRVVPVDLRLGNVALTNDNQMIVIDYGLFITL